MSKAKFPEVKNLPTPEEIKRRFREGEEKSKIYHREIKSKAKPLSKLIVTANFTIEDVISQTTQRIREDGHPENPVFGRSYPISRVVSGYINELTLKVTPEDKIPIRTLTFYGNSIVQAGYKLQAIIPRYKIEKLSKKPSFLPPSRNEKLETYYLDRSFKKLEEAIELAILAEDGTILRRDRSVIYLNYKRYIQASKNKRKKKK